MFDKSCVICDKVFHSKKKLSKYCSIECYWDSIRKIAKINQLENANIWFWSKVKKQANGCMLWTGGKSTQGYGKVSRFRENGHAELAHRVSYLLTNGRYPIGVTRHKCDVKLCCNPNHLTEGSIRDNLHDAYERNLMPVGERSCEAKLNNEDVLLVRQSSLPHYILAKQFGVHDSTIIRIRKRETWKHL